MDQFNPEALLNRLNRIRMEYLAAIGQGKPRNIIKDELRKKHPDLGPMEMFFHDFDKLAGCVVLPSDNGDLTDLANMIGKYAIISSQPLKKTKTSLTWETTRLKNTRAVLEVYDVSQEVAGVIRSRHETLHYIHHPGVERVHEFGCDELTGSYYCVKEWLSGEPLSKRLKKKDVRLHVRDNIEILERAAQALNMTEKHGLFHGNLSPQCIFVDKDLTVKITGYDYPSTLQSLSDPPNDEITEHEQGKRITKLARIQGLRRRRTEKSQLRRRNVMAINNLVVRSPWEHELPYYWSPEQAEGNPVTAESEVYTLGAILYHIVTGKRSVKSDTRQGIIDEIKQPQKPDWPHDLKPAVDRELKRICMKCLERRETWKRGYESAGELAADLKRWLDGKVIALPPDHFWSRLWWWIRGHKWIFIMIVVQTILPCIVWWRWYVYDTKLTTSFEDSVQETQTFIAKQVAARVAYQLQQYSRPVIEIPTLPEFKDLWQRREPVTGGVAQANKELTNLLRHQLQTYNDSRLGYEGQPVLKTIVAMNNEGHLVALWPPGNIGLKVDFNGRDYFRRAKERAEFGYRNPIHVSHVYYSQSDGLFKFSIAVAFKFNGKVEGVLATTLTTVAMGGLAAYRNAKTILVAPIDENDYNRAPARDSQQKYAVFVHPAYLSGTKVANFPYLDHLPLPVDEDSDELTWGSNVREIYPMGDYEDPVVAQAQSDLAKAKLKLGKVQEPKAIEMKAIEIARDEVEKIKKNHGGRYIAGFAAVGNTEMMVVAQKAYDEAVTDPLRKKSRFISDKVDFLLKCLAFFVLPLWLAIELLRKLIYDHSHRWREKLSKKDIKISTKSSSV